jgi:hypothetical protein
VTGAKGAGPCDCDGEKVCGFHAGKPVEIIRYRPQAGDVIMLRFPVHTAESQIKAAMRRLAEETITHPGVNLVAFRGDVEIKVIREESENGA